MPLKDKAMKKIAIALLTSALCLIAQPALAALRVLTCEPEWAALVQELGGDAVSVTSATTALQDAHHIQARPSLIARARNADLLLCTGSDLEVGWLPLLQRQSGNPNIQPDAPGYMEASQFVQRLEIPKALDRSQGDIHPAGNPHVHLDPRNIARIAQALGERLAQLDAPSAAAYRARSANFLQRWEAAIRRWETEAAPLKGLTLVVYHKNMVYLSAWLGLREVGSLEPKPGIPPTTAHLSELVARMQVAPAKVIVYAPYNGPQAAQFLSERTTIPAVMLPYTVGGSEQAKDLFGLFDDTLRRLLAVAK